MCGFTVGPLPRETLADGRGVIRGEPAWKGESSEVSGDAF